MRKLLLPKSDKAEQKKIAKLLGQGGFMKPLLTSTAGLVVLAFLAGCATPPPGAERGPHGTIAYYVPVEASEPAVKIYANNQYVGTAPLTLKIFGDKDGTFHDFGSYYYVVQGVPVNTNQYVQTRVFGTGRHFTHEDRIPQKIYFDMNQPPPPTPPYPPPGYPYPAPYYYPPPAYYYGPPVYWGPSIIVGPHWHHW